LSAARQFVEPLLVEAIAGILTQDGHKDARSALQELTQARFGLTPHYRTVAEYGPDHAKEFVVEVVLGTLAYGRGSGPTKQGAGRLAAADALARLAEVEDLALAEPIAPADIPL